MPGIVDLDAKIDATHAEIAATKAELDKLDKLGDTEKYELTLKKFATQAKILEVEIHIRFGIKPGREHYWLSIAAAVAGALAALATLADGFAPALESIKSFLFWSKQGSLFVTPAFAEGIGPVATGGTVLPAFLYVVYALLSLAYIGALYGMFWSTDAKHRVHGLEVFKLLTPFFIGTVSGKIL